MAKVKGDTMAKLKAQTKMAPMKAKMGGKMPMKTPVTKTAKGKRGKMIEERYGHLPV